MNLDQSQGLIAKKLTVALLIVLVVVFLIAYFFYALQPTFASNTPVEVTITKGTSFRGISAQLSQKNLIRSIVVFKIYALLTGNATKMQAGTYELASTMSIPDIVKTLVAGSKNDVTVQITEGATLKDIDEILASSSIITSGSLVNFNFQNLANQYSFLSKVSSLEGFLFPDTYNFSINSNVEDVVKKMLNNFELKAWPLLESNPNWYQKLILASYLEKEAKNLDDQKKISGILEKRLANKMTLDVDATLVYLKCDGRFLTCKETSLSSEDKKINSDYNTYLKLGFTPTPIANPGLNSIIAALHPETTPYFYYCTKDGKTIFAKNLKDQNNQCF